MARVRSTPSRRRRRSRWRHAVTTALWEMRRTRRREGAVGGPVPFLVSPRGAPYQGATRNGTFVPLSIFFSRSVIIQTLYVIFALKLPTRKPIRGYGPGWGHSGAASRVSGRNPRGRRTGHRTHRRSLARESRPRRGSVAADPRKPRRPDRIGDQPGVHDHHPGHGARSGDHRPVQSGVQAGDPIRWRRQLHGDRHRPLRLHRHPARHLHPGRHPGERLHPARHASAAQTRCPSRSSTPPATSTSPRTTAPRSTSSRPSGSLLWSVDPQQGNPTALFSVGTGASWQLMVSLTQDTSSSLVLNPGDRRLGRYLPAGLGARRVRHPGGRRQPAVLGQRLRRDGQPDRPGPLHVRLPQHRRTTASTPDRAASSTTRPRRSRARRDHLHGRPALHDGGDVTQRLPPGLDHSRRCPGLRRLGLRPRRFDLLLPERAAVQRRRRRHLHLLAGQRAVLPRGGPAPHEHARLGCRARHPGPGNYFAPGTTPVVDATFDPWWTAVAPGLQLSYSVENLASLDRRDGPHTDGRSLSRRRRLRWPTSHSSCRPPTPSPVPTRSRPPW